MKLTKDTCHNCARRDRCIYRKLGQFCMKKGQ